VLGVGGRIAMRVVARVAGSPGGFSFGGTLTVVFLGAVSGLAGALVLLALRSVVRTRPLLRGVLFWAFLILVTLRGLRPLDAQRVILFFPLVLIFGAGLQVIWCRVYLARKDSRTGPAGASSGGPRTLEPTTGDLGLTTGGGWLRS